MRQVLEGNSGAPVASRNDDEITLSPRQIECLSWVQEGKSSRDIGVILGAAGRTNTDKTPCPEPP